MPEQKSSRKSEIPRSSGRGMGGHGGGRIEKAKDTRKAMRRLLAYMRDHNASLIGVIGLSVLYTLAILLAPYLMGIAIDQFISSGDAAGLLQVVLFMLAAYLTAWLSQASAGHIMAHVSQKVLRRLRKELFEHLQTLSLSYFDRNPHGELMSRLTNDIDAINQTLSQNVVSLFTSILSMFGILIAMFILNPWLALASLIVIPLMGFITAMIARKTRKGFRELQKDLGKINGTMEEAISGLRVIKAYGQNKSVIEKFTRENESVYKTAVYAQSYSLLLMPLTGIMGNINIAVLAAFGGWLALQGLITIGTIATFLTYGQQFTHPLRQLANLYNTLQSALAGAERVFDLIDTQPELMDSANAIALSEVKGDVRFEDVSFSYKKGIPVLQGINLHANPGETIALVGPTGAGKTTIVNLLTRFYDIDSGQIKIDGKSIREYKKADLRRQLGMVLQDTFLFSDSVMDNIRYGRLEATEEECIQAATLANADHFIRRLPEGYHTRLAERGTNLSQGQRQLIAIARAILADPGILILDEATSSVDTRTEINIQRALLTLMKGRTSFVIAHRLSTIRDADQVLVIDDGHIIERGTHEELLTLRGFYYNLYISQFRQKAA